MIYLYTWFDFFLFLFPLFPFSFHNASHACSAQGALYVCSRIHLQHTRVSRALSMIVVHIVSWG